MNGNGILEFNLISLNLCDGCHRRGRQSQRIPGKRWAEANGVRNGGMD